MSRLNLSEELPSLSECESSEELPILPEEPPEELQSVPQRNGTFRDAINYDGVSMCGMVAAEWEAGATAMSSLGSSTIDPTNAAETVLGSSLSLSEFNNQAHHFSPRELIDLDFTDPVGVSFLQEGQIRGDPARFELSMNVDSFRYVTLGLRLSKGFNPVLLIKSNLGVSRDNHVKANVTVAGRTRSMNLSQVPNFVMLQGGNSDVFSVSIFFPALTTLEDGYYNTRVDDAIQQRWFNDYLWPALQRFSTRRPIQRIPPSYAMAKKSAYHARGGRIDNGILPDVVDYLYRTTTDDDQYHDFFLFVSAANLKSLQIDSMDVWFNDWIPIETEFISWADYFVDVAFNATMKPRDAAHYASKTLLFHQENLRNLVYNSGYRTPTLDAYMHSSTIEGLRADHSTVDNVSHIAYLQAYHADKTCTYAGSGKTVVKCVNDLDLVEGTSKYKNVVQHLQMAYEHSRSVQFGVRLEVNCSVQAADYILKAGPGPILETLLKYDTLLALDTAEVMDYKEYLVGLAFYGPKGADVAMPQDSQRAHSIDAVYSLLYESACIAPG